MSSAHGGSRVGTRFGPYELRSVIGVGGMGEVYRAYDTGKERMVAVKLLRAELAADPKFQERFRRESRVAARLQEPHVIPVHDFGDIDGVLYIEMRLVEGPSLRDLLHSGGPIEPRRAASIITQVASALDAAHADGLVHRDIKPENVLLTNDDFAYLVDFGIAHAGGDASVTMTGMVVGSSAYMAAERFSGSNPPGPASDIYSLTCVLFEALTGRPPFDSQDLQQLLGAHMFAAPPRPSVLRPEIGRAFDDVIARGMAKQPADRFPSAAALAKAATAAASTASPLMSQHGRPPAAGRPASTRQFTSLYANPAATGYTPYPPPPARPTPPPAPVRKARFGPAQIALAAATLVLFGTAAILAVLLVNGGDGSTSPSRLAAPPTSTTPSPTATSPSTPATTTTTTTTTTTSPGPVRMSGADEQGFVGHSARCDSGSSPAAMIRTAHSLAVICQSGSDDFYYRGERLRDGAALELAHAVPSGGGFDAVNPADGARYQVRPDGLTILSDRGVDSAEPALQYAAERP
ncbi:protein kinase [Mycolicibacterium chitae]|uniref:non-specific serine/threonine protein kinase n=2 Tax=Mycolicibacterium chitae TaxID=1792 RepID=A0A448I9P7_MYCCI|nr:serine/threonine-protein kinase [Mycolicibacterium chitae]BBZ05541.1 protein kinase [Mycolicibacterium chitae]VEG49155.1 serine/threonine protein kinase [Mycolicibacterium chitae]